jgi:hypothetical protein
MSLGVGAVTVVFDAIGRRANRRGTTRGRFRRVDVAIVVRQDLVSDGAKIQLLAEQQTIKIHGEQSPVGPVSPSEFSKADIRGVIAQVGTLTMALQCEDVSS